MSESSPVIACIYFHCLFVCECLAISNPYPCSTGNVVYDKQIEWHHARAVGRPARLLSDYSEAMKHYLTSTWDPYHEPPGTFDSTGARVMNEIEAALANEMHSPKLACREHATTYTTRTSLIRIIHDLELPPILRHSIPPGCFNDDISSAVFHVCVSRATATNEHVPAGCTVQSSLRKV